MTLSYRWCAAVTLLWGIGACATDPSHQLHGQWGGQGFGMTANDVIVRITLPCSAIGVFRGPLVADEQGRFTLEGEVSHFYGTYHVSIAGEEVQPRVLRVSIVASYGSSRNPEIVVLALKDAEPDFSDYICLASAARTQDPGRRFPPSKYP